MAEQTWINNVAGYSSLAPCAERRLSIIARDQSSGCGQSTSYDCFCYTKYATMETIIARGVSSACLDGADGNSAVGIFASYCGSTPILTLPVTQAAVTALAIASLSIAAATTRSSNVSSSELSKFTTSIRSDSLPNSSSASSAPRMRSTTSGYSIQTSTNLYISEQNKFLIRILVLLLQH